VGWFCSPTLEGVNPKAMWPRTNDLVTIGLRPGAKKMSASQEITQLLEQWSDGDKEALEKLTPVLYKELHRMAHRYMRQERPGHTLQTTALINEAYLRLIAWKDVRWQNRAQFFGVSAQLMRKILVDFARSRNYAKRGGGARAISLEEVPAVSPDRARDIVAVDDALQRLAIIDPRKSQIVELRFFGGLTLEETAEVVKVSSRTIRREWDLAKTWLSREMSAETAR
jgi:RNA polymerase sigma factor (TIGR02999 family)